MGVGRVGDAGVLLLQHYEVLRVAPRMTERRLADFVQFVIESSDDAGQPEATAPWRETLGRLETDPYSWFETGRYNWSEANPTRPSYTQSPVPRWRRSCASRASAKLESASMSMPSRGSI